ncbi:MAG: 3'-5' exonuclease [Prevotella sp.]|jgi:DNA polymerase-3 subunit epsilon|nr:3'-5' exonuclease [Prevotella sp.]
MKIIFFDTETTDLDPRLGGMHQLAGDIVIDGVIKDQFDYRINPFKEAVLNPESLRISNTSVLDLMRYAKEYQVQYMFNDLLEKHGGLEEKFLLAGWRAPEFDVKFLKAFFVRNGSEILFGTYFWNNPIDVKSLASQYLMEERPQMESFSLAPVASHLGIPVEDNKLHTAAYDAYLCRKVYKVVTQK